MIRFGIKSFVRNQQGYSFVAVRAPIEQVATKLEAQPSVVEYERDVKPEKMKDGVTVQAAKKLRHTFLVQMGHTPEWSVLIQTVHWFYSCDSIMATALACALSKDLQTLSVAA